MKRKGYPGRSSYGNRYPYKKRRINGGYKKRYGRAFVPRTMGPFAQTETKYVDGALSAQAISEATTWVGSELDPNAPTQTLFAPEQGTQVYQRIGRKVSLFKLSIRGVITNTALSDQADVVSSPAVRIIVYMDKQTNGTQSQGEDVMALGDVADTNVADTTELAFSSFQNVKNFGRFRVLKDVIYRPRIVTAVTDGASTSSQNTSQIPFKLNIKFRKPVQVRFDLSSTSGSIADIVDNSFHMIGLKSGAGFASTITYVCRGYYKDA